MNFMFVQPKPFINPSIYESDTPVYIGRSIQIGSKGIYLRGAPLADGGTVDLDTALEVIEKGMDVPKEARPESPGGTGDPVLYEDED